MLTKYILAALSIIFLTLALARLGKAAGQTRAWLLIGVIFGLVSAWLFYQG